MQVSLPTHTVECLTWGPDDGPLALLLHGFPDTAHTWRHLGPELAAAGWRVVAPFLRGYQPSGIPSDRCYTVGALAADAAALHRELGGDERAVLVGHDWGAITATTLAAHADSPFSKVVAMAVPPLGAMNPTRDTLRPWLGAIARQPFNSWYIFANQVPGLSESDRVFDRFVARLWRSWSPGYDATDDLALLKESVPDRDHAHAVISYYRAFLRPGPGASAYTSWMASMMDLPRVPLLYLQGADDGCLDRRFFTLAAARLDARDGHRFDLVPATGHFLQLEDPGFVNPLVLRFLG